jgi:hypothetical protein
MDAAVLHVIYYNYFQIKYTLKKQRKIELKILKIYTIFDYW